MELETEGVNFIIRMEDSMTASGKTMKCMEKVFYIILVANLRTMGTGLKVSLKDLVSCLMKIQHNCNNLSISLILTWLKNSGLNMMENSRTIIKKVFIYK
jgi:hypothetical protein